MNALAYLLAGGFLAGYRTYLLGFLIFLQAVIAWGLGDMTLAQLVEKFPELLGGLGLMSLRAAVPKA